MSGILVIYFAAPTAQGQSGVQILAARSWPVKRNGRNREEDWQGKGGTLRNIKRQRWRLLKCNGGVELEPERQNSHDQCPIDQYAAAS